ncbi:hypothetical protein KK449_18335 [Clostridioides difficile]|nr:hypothetical protein [Clostridioides difficile]
MATGGAENFPFTPHTTALRNLPNGAGSFSGFTYLLRVIFDFAKWTQKAANLFQTYCFRWPLVGG